MKKLLLCTFLFITGFRLIAQTEIRNEILAFTDSTELIIRNGRKLIVEKTITGQHDAAISTLNYLKKTINEKYVILYPAEEILVSLANRNFGLFLYTAKNIKHLMDNKVRIFQMPSISEEIHQYLGNEILFISEDVTNSNLPDSEKELIQLYIRFYLNENYTELNKTIKQHQRKNQKSEYIDFLNDLIQLTLTGRMNFSLGYGNEFLSGNITRNFDNHLHVMNFEIDGFMNRLYLSLFMGGSVSREVSKNDLPVKKKDWTHLAGESVSTLKYGLKIGRSLYSTDNLNFYPFILIGGYEFNSQSPQADKKDSELKNNLSGAFCTGFGASCDFVLKKWETRNYVDPVGFLFIRPSIGYDFFMTNKELAKGGDFYFNVSLGVSLGSIR
jgi:hypothetical protein